MDTIKVSIIVPAFNVEAYIDECLNSLTLQTLREIEIIVINDGSTDATGTIAALHSEQDARIKVIHQENKGPSNARNTGISVAQGEYIGFVDSDDWVEPFTYEHLYNRANSFDADIVLGTILYCYENGSQYRLGEKDQVFRDENAQIGKMCFATLIDTGCYIPMVCTNLYKADLIKQYNLSFKGTYHEDEYFTPYAFYFAQRVIDFREDFYHYRQHAQSIMHAANQTLKAEALYDIGQTLLNFANNELTGKESKEVVRAYRLQAIALSNRARIIQNKLQSAKLPVQKKKHLFIFTQESKAAKYGVGTYTKQLIECFDLTEWYIHLVELNSFAECYNVKEENEIRYYQVPIPKTANAQWDEEKNKLYSQSIFYLLATRVTMGEEVCCHFNFAQERELALLFKNKLQAKIVLTLHYTDWSFDLLGDRERLQQILNNPSDAKEHGVVWRFERERKFMTECCDKVIAIAHHSYDTLLTLYKIPETQLVYIPNALKDEYTERSEAEIAQLRKKYHVEPHEKLIIFAGRLDIVKGTGRLLKAFKLLQAKVSDVRLIIAGDGDYKSCFDAVNPCWTKVTFTGFVSKEQLYELYAIADIGIVPSWYEEFGYVAVEMMMNKLPVIVSDTTGLKEIVDNGKYGQLMNAEIQKDPILYMKFIYKILLSTSNKNFQEIGRLRFQQTYCMETFKKKIKLLYTDII